MKRSHFIAFVLLSATLLSLSSCSLFFSRISSDDGPDFVDSDTKYIPKEPVDRSEAPTTDNDLPTTASAPTIDDIIDGTDPLPSANELLSLGENLEIFSFDNGNCALLYNEKGAWVFDYQLSKATPLVDLDAMLYAADPKALAHEHFADVNLSYEFFERETELRIHYTATSTASSESKYVVYSFYSINSPSDERGTHRGYYLEDIAYPGSNDPISVSSLDELDKLYMPYENGDEPYIISAARAFLSNDTDGLEEILNLKDGLLSVWKGTVIKDYTISRELPMHNWIDSLTLEFTIENSTVERYPDGRYTTVIYDGINIGFEIERKDPMGAIHDPLRPDAEKAKEWAITWATSYGGSWDLNKQNPNDDTFGHCMYDYLAFRVADELGIDGNLTGNKYRELARDYLGMDNFENSFTAYGDNVINHGGHGNSSVLCETVDYYGASGIHEITVNFYADPLKSVVAKTYVYTFIQNYPEVYTLYETECTYDSGLSLYGWSV